MPTALRLFAGLTLAALMSVPASAQAPAEFPPIASSPEAGPAALAPEVSPTVAAPAPVAVESLSVLDLFSVGAGPGLGADLWKASSADLARKVIPLLAAKPLSPAFAAFGRHVLSTSASGPEDGGSDPGLAAARAGGLLALGDAAGADQILSGTSGLAASPALSQVAAEAALITGQEDKACRIGDALTSGRADVYWLRLRAFCQAKAGNAGAAQLTLDLADNQAKDSVFRRLMTVVIAGSGNPGAASLRNGLDLAISRRLGLDLSAAKAPPSIALVLAPQAPPAPVAETAFDAAGKPGFADSGNAAGATAAAFYAALGRPLSPSDRAALAGFDLGRSTAPPARLLALQLAVQAGARGDVAMLALWIAADAGPAGPALADRVAIVSALRQMGMAADARIIAAEALAPPPTP